MTYKYNKIVHILISLKYKNQNRNSKNSKLHILMRIWIWFSLNFNFSLNRSTKRQKIKQKTDKSLKIKSFKFLSTAFGPLVHGASRAFRRRAGVAPAQVPVNRQAAEIDSFAVAGRGGARGAGIVSRLRTFFGVTVRNISSVRHSLGKRAVYLFSARRLEHVVGLLAVGLLFGSKGHGSGVDGAPGHQRRNVAGGRLYQRSVWNERVFCGRDGDFGG